VHLSLLYEQGRHRRIAFHVTAGARDGCGDGIRQDLGHSAGEGTDAGTMRRLHSLRQKPEQHVGGMLFGGQEEDAFSQRHEDRFIARRLTPWRRAYP
jgi:hypothetical protein